MATHLAEADLIDPRPRHQATARVRAADDRDEIDDGARHNPARGILIAALISMPFWVLIAYTLYLLR
jgi:hypothetical protein